MPRASIIAFVGTVGSGKSTQMTLLASELRRRGIKVKVSFLKSGHIFAYLFQNFLAWMFVKKRKDVHPVRALIEDKPHIFRRFFKLWLILNLISICIKFILNIYIPLKLGYVILVEEYFPATISTHIYLGKLLNFKLKPRSFAITFLLRLMYLGGFTRMVFLDAEDSMLKYHWKRRGSLNERRDYLDMQRSLLLQISRKLSSDKLLYVNTSKQTIRETHQLIARHLILV